MHRMPLDPQDLSRPGILLICFSAQMVPDPEWLCSVSLLLLMKVARATHVEQWPQDKSHLMRVLFCPLHFLQKVTSDLNEQQENFGRETEGNVPEGQLATGGAGRGNMGWG